MLCKHLPIFERRKKKESAATTQSTKKMKDACEDDSSDNNETNFYELTPTPPTATNEIKKDSSITHNKDIARTTDIHHIQHIQNKEKINVQSIITKESHLITRVISSESHLITSENKDDGQLQIEEDKSSLNNKHVNGPAVDVYDEREEEFDRENLIIKEEPEDDDDLRVPDTLTELVDSSSTEELSEHYLNNEDEPIVPRDAHINDVNAHAHTGNDEEHESCLHHDMAETLTHEYSDNNTKSHVREPHCSHSDAVVKLSKPVKVNRVSPFRYGDVEAGKLLIDLTDSELEDYKRHKLKLQAEYNLALKTKRSIGEEESVSRRVVVNGGGGYSTDDLRVTQERFSTDLPRHNWLVKRLKQQNQLNEGDIISLHTASPQINEDSSNELNKKERKKAAVVDMRSNGGLAAISQSQITGNPTSPKGSFDHVTKSDENEEQQIKTLSPLSIKKNNSPSSLKDANETEDRSPTAKSGDFENESFPSPKSYTSTNGPSTTLSHYVNNSSSSASSPTKSVSISDLKPKLIMSTSQQSATSPKGYPSSLPGIDLSTLKYDSLSRFNQSPKAAHAQQTQAQQPPFYPTISSAYSLAPYEGRNIREVARPMPLHVKESYKSEQDAFGMNHRVRLSFTPLSSTKEKSSIYMNQNIDKTPSMMKNYDTFPAGVGNNATSPEELKRTVAIQRQLENQKRWIAEHEPYKVGGSKYIERESRPNPQATSPQNPTNLPPGSRYPPPRPQNDDVYNNPEHLSLLQSRDHLREKIDACNKEIKNIQQQKDVLFARQQGIPNTDSPTHLRIIALNRKLSSLEDYRMKQSALLMKIEAQPFDSLITPRDHRSQIPVRKPNYPDGINGSLPDGDDLPGPKRMNFPTDQSENLLLRQLQSKHDEGSTMVMTDAHCRTIDLSKSSELFYNDMRMEAHPSMSKPSTPMSNPALKDYPHSGEIPPLVSAERLQQNGIPQDKTPDFPPRGSSGGGQQTPYSKSPEIPRQMSITHSAHELANSIQREMARDQSRYTQFERIARARELQHSLQLQDAVRAASSHEMAQIQERLSLRGPRPEMTNGRPDHPQELSKTRDLNNFPHHIQQSESSPYSPGGSIPHSQPFPDPPPSYDELRVKELSMKRHSNEPTRPGQLKLARTVSNMAAHQIHPSQMAAERKYQKIHQQQTLESKYSPSSISSSMIGGGPGEEGPYKQRARYDMAPNSNEYESNARLSSSYSASIASQQQQQQPEKQKLRVRTCNACDKESQFLCSGCRGIWYCSRECQLDDWKVHSKNCRKK